MIPPGWWYLAVVAGLGLLAAQVNWWLVRRLYRRLQAEPEVETGPLPRTGLAYLLMLLLVSFVIAGWSVGFYYLSVGYHTCLPRFHLDVRDPFLPSVVGGCAMSIMALPLWIWAVWWLCRPEVPTTLFDLRSMTATLWQPWFRLLLVLTPMFAASGVLLSMDHYARFRQNAFYTSPFWNVGETMYTYDQVTQIRFQRTSSGEPEVRIQEEDADLWQVIGTRGAVGETLGGLLNFLETKTGRRIERGS